MNRRALVIALGGSIFLPVAAIAQPTKKIRLGLLVVVPFPPLTDPFLQALRERGWVVGRNLDVEIRASESDPALALSLAREFVEQGVDVIVTVATLGQLVEFSKLGAAA